MIMARNEDSTYSQVGFVKDNVGIDTEYIYDKDGDIVFEKGFTRETSGTVPLTINGIGKDLKDWSITGNTVQNGTPTPENPVEVQAVGDRTGNLFDVLSLVNNMHLDNVTGLPTSYTGRIASPNPVNVAQYSSVTISYTTEALTKAMCSLFSNDELVGRFTEISSGTVIDVSNADKMYICFYSTWGGNINTSSVSDIMLNSGSTALPYEPYGYKIPIVTRGKNLLDYNLMFQNGVVYNDYFNVYNLILKPYTEYEISTNGEEKIFTNPLLQNKETQFIVCNTSELFSTANGGVSYKKKLFKTTGADGVLVVGYRTKHSEEGANIVNKADMDAGILWLNIIQTPIITPIYLPTPLYSGEVIRSDGSREVKWKKLVLTGKETISKNTNESTNYLYYMPISTNEKINGYCSHLISRNGAPMSVIGFNTNSSFPVIYFNFGADIMNAQPSGNTINGFKEYLAAQYAAGTPVTVWYPLVKPITETFTAPQIPTLNGTTVIDVDTSVKPTEMYTKYKSSK